MKKKKGALFALGGLGVSTGLYRLLKNRRFKGKAVLILGNGRSGTSVLTRALNFMGVDLGSDKFRPKASANPKGYFENLKIENTHKKIIEVFKSRPMPHGYEHKLALSPFKNELKEYVKDQFLDKEVWGWKDPRTNDFLEMWQDILSDLQVEPHYVIIIRNPVDVVNSYSNAWNKDETHSLRLWQIRTLLALKNSFGGKRVIVSYEELFANPLECLRRISKTLNLPWPKNEANLKDELDAFIDPDLQKTNSDTSDEDFINRKDIGYDVKELYLLALEGTRSQKYFESKGFHEKVEEMYQDYVRDYGYKSSKKKKTKQPQ